MRIALAQLNPTSGDINGNAAKIIDAIDQASAAGADLVVTPEMALPGYCIGDLVEDEGFLAANEIAMRRIADHARGITAVVGFIDFNASARNESGAIRRYNAAAVVRDGQVLQRAHKTLLPSYRYFDDKRFFVPGDTREPVTIPIKAGDVRIGVSICEDLWDEFYRIKPLAELAAKGADVLLNLNASPFCPGKRQERDDIIRRHLADVRKPLVYINTTGAADNGKNIIPFDGESLVYDAAGRLIAIGRQFDEQLLVVDAHRLQQVRSEQLLGLGDIAGPPSLSVADDVGPLHRLLGEADLVTFRIEWKVSFRRTQYDLVGVGSGDCLGWRRCGWLGFPAGRRLLGSFWIWVLLGHAAPPRMSAMFPIPFIVVYL